jgi:hypothetical protein
MIPTAIGALTGLEQLSVDQQELFGMIPSDLSLLTALGKNQSLLSRGLMLKKGRWYTNRLLFTISSTRLV